MITCSSCGKLTGGPVQGTSWICTDCKVPAKPGASTGQNDTRTTKGQADR